ncbi:glycosyltransferase [Rhodococcoides fascians]|uniref:glycosyltransferase n=1 Tax=Rhodococcoides fascians TaxID=1828 RepID=UPI0027DE3A5B|nr:glycosyltransferase [Rhodococcus fascians]
MKATFLLAKDPSHESTGDLTMARLVMGIAAESYDVRAICLSTRPESTADGWRRVPKADADIKTIALRSARYRKSLVHSRFDIDSVVAAIDDTDSDIFVADHTYMAEPFLRSTKAGTIPLAVSTVVSETLVWKATRGLIGKLDSTRILRDELRVARGAYTVGTYDEDEAEFYRRAGIARTHWLDLTLPPKKQVNIANSGNRLVFFGDRTWPPNQEAYKILLGWWPQICAGIDDAELCIVGTPHPDAADLDLPDGVRDLGFVDDLAGFLDTCRALVAPIATGGGVRVKILDAASRGLPVVGTPAAVGSLSSALGIEGIADPAVAIERCREFLLDRSAAVAAGRGLYERGEQRWQSRVPHDSVHDWLRPC